VRYVNVIRLLRLALLVRDLSPDFRFIMDALVAVFKGSAQFILQLFLWTALFVTVGVQAFGGTVYQTNPRLEGTALATGYQEVLNFNDFAMGFVPFIVTLVSAGPNSDLILGIGAAADADGAAKIFFITYYYTTQLLVLNVLISFIVTAYTLRYDAREEEGDDYEVDGLDKTQLEKLRSLYGSLPVEEGYKVLTHGRDGSDVLLRRMFHDEIDLATTEVSSVATPRRPRRVSDAGTFGALARRRGGSVSAGESHRLSVTVGASSRQSMGS